MAAFDPIVVDRIDMPSQILLIAYCVLPEAPLPNLPFLFARTTPQKPPVFRDPCREPCLDIVPLGGEIAIPQWQGPNPVKMIGKDNDRFESEGSVTAGIGKDDSQLGDVIRQQKGAALQQVDGEKEGPAGNEGANVVWHFLGRER